MDIEIVLDGVRVVGASAKRQGAELIRADEATRLVDEQMGTAECPVNPDLPAASREAFHRAMYDRMVIVNTELQDVDR